MALAKRPQPAAKVQPSDAAAEAFIAGAAHRPAAPPPAPPPAKPASRRKERVMIQMSQAVLDRVDAAAERRGVSRSAWIQFVISRAIDSGDG